MISLEQALALLRNYAPRFKTKEVALNEALGSFLAEDIFAPMDLPPFDNSSVDGFAIRSTDLLENPIVEVKKNIRAVGQNKSILAPRSCAAIMTGAPIPEGADAVVMKEQVERQENFVKFPYLIEPGQHIRQQGGDIARGSLVASRGSKMSPALMGLLLGLGITRIQIFSMPRVAIICTGDELVNPPAVLDYGQVYFLLGAMLKAQCQTLGIDNVEVIQVGDDQRAIETAINRSLNADIILLTGGMSQGDHDLVRPALSRLGVEQIFWQGAWRPGKPLYFGMKDEIRVFGLPGNPVASFVGFHIFVRTMLSQSLHNPLAPKSGRLAHDYQKAPGWSLFLRAHTDSSNTLTILANQDSHQIFTLSRSNALCLIEAPTTMVKAGAFVYYYPL